MTSARSRFTPLVRETLTLLLGAFVALKLAHMVTWSWWWVTAPFWVPCGVAFILALGLAIGRWVAGEDERGGP